MRSCFTLIFLDLLFYLDGKSATLMMSWSFAPSCADGFYGSFWQLFAILQKVDLHPSQALNLLLVFRVILSGQVPATEELGEAHKWLHHSFHSSAALETVQFTMAVTVGIFSWKKKRGKIQKSTICTIFSFSWHKKRGKIQKKCQLKEVYFPHWTKKKVNIKSFQKFSWWHSVQST